MRATTAIAAATAVGLFGGVSPAFAEGAGASTGQSDIGAHGTLQAGAVPCIQNANGANSTAHIHLTNVGNVTAVQATPSPSGAEYAGVWTANLTINGNFYFNPAGVFSDPACTMPTRVPVVGASFTGSNPAALPETLSCSGVLPVTVSQPPAPPQSQNVSYYTRVANVYTITVYTTCTVTDTVQSVGTVSAQQTVAFVFTGNETPCLGDFPVPDPCIDAGNGTGPTGYASTEFVGVYTES